MNLNHDEIVPPTTIETPLIHAYTGDGKGKTTAAFGLAMRASGHGFRVYVIQFMKGSIYSGETISTMRLSPQIHVEHFGRECPNALGIAMGWTKCAGCGKCFIKNGEVTLEDIEQAKGAYDRVIEIFEGDEADMVVLDEISNAINLGVMDVVQAVELVKKRPDKVELILTGRSMPEELLDLADLVTEMKAVKHPFEKGVCARRGVEY